MALSREPQMINRDWWYYEVKRGIEIYHPIGDSGGYIKTDYVIIPWDKIRASLKRKDKRRV